MVNLDFRVEGAEPQRFAAAPLMLFKLRITEAVAAEGVPTPVQMIGLRCQIRIEPARRRYEAEEQERLVDLFGTPERWGQTLRPLLWTQVSTVTPPVTGSAVVDLAVPCDHDVSLAATRYFAALEGGELPLCFLFSGTVFYESASGALQVAQIPWEKEATYGLPVSAWRGLMDHYYPNMTWLRLRRDLFDRFDRFRSRQGLPTADQALEQLLRTAEGAAS